MHFDYDNTSPMVKIVSFGFLVPAWQQMQVRVIQLCTAFRENVTRAPAVIPDVSLSHFL